MIPSAISPDTNYSESDFNEADPILTIHSELDRRFKNLQDYSLKPNAKQHYINSEKQSFQTLRQAANKLQRLKYYPFWLSIEKRINGFLEKDDSIEIVTLVLKKPGCSDDTHRHAYLQLDLNFSHGKA